SINDLLQVDGLFTKEEFVRRMNRIMLPPMVFLEPTNYSELRISHIYDLYEEYPEKISQIENLRIPRFYQLHSSLQTPDKNIHSKQNLYYNNCNSTQIKNNK